MELAIASAVVAGIGGGVSATGQIMAGREQSRAAMFEAQQKDREGEQLKIAAAQTEARRREGLTSSLETIMSIRAGRGVGEGSPTGMASLEEITSDESRDIRTERYNYLSRAEQTRLASSMSRRKAKMSLLAGYMGAGATIADTGARIMGGRAFGGGGSGSSGEGMSSGYRR